MPKSIMVMGTASHVGKSVLATALCRILAQDGYQVAPFKAQNMSLNSAVTPSGREIGRSQAAQAEACGILPNEHMNPVLLKPTSRTESQIVLQGRVYQRALDVAQECDLTELLWAHVVESYEYLAHRHAVLVIEGAGSPVEMNLKSRDLANMRTAHLADADVILVADIDRGGIFASVSGTMSLLTLEERARVKGIIVNRFRGDPALFADGVAILEGLTGVPVLGVIPYMDHVGIDEEDGVALEHQGTTLVSNERQALQMHPAEPRQQIHIAVILLPHISNFTDLDPLFLEPDVDVHYVQHSSQLSVAVDAVVLPGSKNTIEDLIWMHEVGLVQAIRAFKSTKRSVAVLGICGGYQMLGQMVADPEHQETHRESCCGIGLLPSTSVLRSKKQTRLVSGQLQSVFEGIPVEGYEIHMGETVGRTGEPFVVLSPAADSQKSREDGECSEDGFVIGTYVHGIFHNDEFRTAWLNALRQVKGLSIRQSPGICMNSIRKDAYDRVADVVRSHLNMDAIHKMLSDTNEATCGTMDSNV